MSRDHGKCMDTPKTIVYISKWIKSLFEMMIWQTSSNKIDSRHQKETNCSAGVDIMSYSISPIQLLRQILEMGEFKLQPSVFPYVRPVLDSIHRYFYNFITQENSRLIFKISRILLLLAHQCRHMYVRITRITKPR